MLRYLAGYEMSKALEWVRAIAVGLTLGAIAIFIVSLFFAGPTNQVSKALPVQQTAASGAVDIGGRPIGSAISPLDGYLSEMRPFWKMAAQAWAARVCSLRSERWFASINSGLMTISDGTHHEYDALSPAEQAAADRDRKATFDGEQQTVLGAGLVSGCANLSGSVTMDALDRLETSATGNYH